MPAGKMFFYKSKRRSRKTYKKSRRLGVPRSLPLYRSKQPFMRLQRTFYVENWTPQTATIAGYWRYLTTTAATIPNIAEYTSLFDMYKVNSMKITLRPRYDSFAGNDTVDTTLPGVTNQGGTNVHVLIDPTSRTIPAGVYNGTTLNTFLENGKVRSYTGNKPINIFIKYPCVGDDVNGVSGLTVRKAKWMNCAGSGTLVGLAGAHVFLQDTNFTGTFNQSYDIFWTLDISFRGMR